MQPDSFLELKSWDKKQQASWNKRNYNQIARLFIYLLTVRVVKYWNKLPIEVVETLTLEPFMTRHGSEQLDLTEELD